MEEIDWSAPWPSHPLEKGTGVVLRRKGRTVQFWSWGAKAWAKTEEACWLVPEWTTYDETGGPRLRVRSGLSGPAMATEWTTYDETWCEPEAEE